MEGLISLIEKEHFSPRFSCSDVATISNLNPYGDIVEAFEKYLYQNIDLVREADINYCQNILKEIKENEKLEVKEVIDELETENFIQLLPTEDEIKRILNNLPPIISQPLTSILNLLETHPEELQFSSQANKLIEKVNETQELYDIFYGRKDKEERRKRKEEEEEMKKIKQKIKEEDEEDTFNLHLIKFMDEIEGSEEKVEENIITKEEITEDQKEEENNKELIIKEKREHEEKEKDALFYSRFLEFPVLLSEFSFFLSQLRGIIRKTYGTNVESRSLDRYEEITGYPIVERNDQYYLLNFPMNPEDSAKENEKEQAKEVEDEDEEDDEEESEEDYEKENDCSVSSTKNSLSLKISSCTSTSSNSSTSSISIFSSSTTTSSPSMEEKEQLLIEETEEYNNDIEMKKEENMEENKKLALIFTKKRFLKSDFKKKNKKTKKLKKNSLAFSLIGKVDGVSYQYIDKSSSSSTSLSFSTSSSTSSSSSSSLASTSEKLLYQTKEKVVIEMKNRVRRIQEPPHLHEQIQLVAYLIMNGSSVGHLVQVLAKAPKDQEISNKVIQNLNENDESSSSTSILSSSTSLSLVKDEEEILISKVFLEGPPFYHKYYWDTVIVPRLYQFRIALESVRKSTEMRRNFLMMTADEKKEFIFKLCPYF